MLAGIHQLHYLPWLRYFEKIARSDVFIVLDNIQFNKNGWQNRNRVKTVGGALLLTVPVYEKLGQTLDSVRIDNTTPWARKHWRTIEQAYIKAPYFAAHAPFLSDTYDRAWDHLNDLNQHMLDYFIETLGITTRIVYASSLEVTGTATERLAGLIRAVGCDRYYTGAHAAGTYLDEGLLASSGIGIETQAWHAPVYPQRHGAFVPDLSILDLLMNCGPESLRVVMGEIP